MENFNIENLPPCDPNSPDWTIDWQDLKEICRRVLEGDIPNVRSGNQRILTKCLHGADDSFNGFTAPELLRWMAVGFPTAAIQGLSEFTPPIRDKRRMIFSEEGDEFHVDLALAGEENFMSRFTKRQVIPGVSLDCMITFSAYIPAHVVNAYNTWICRTVYSLESAGIDCEVTLTNPVRRAMPGVDPNTVQLTKVRVKKQNEISDFVSISPMLSPAALRGFLFAAKALHAESRGVTVSSGLGAPASKEWSVKYDKETRRIVVSCNGAAKSFPEEEMTNQFRQALKDAMSG